MSEIFPENDSAEREHESAHKELRNRRLKLSCPAGLFKVDGDGSRMGWKQVRRITRLCRIFSRGRLLLFPPVACPLTVFDLNFGDEAIASGRHGLDIFCFPGAFAQGF